MSNIYNVSKQQLSKIGGDPSDLVNTFEVKKAQVEKLGGDLTKVNDIYTAELQVLEHIDGGGATLQEKSVSITANGTTDVMPDEGFDGMSKVSVDVNVPNPELEELNVTTNGTYTPTKYGYSKVDVAVPSKPEQTKSVTITENGTTSVLPDEGSVLSKVDVTVNVAGGGGGDLFGFDAIGYDGTEQSIKNGIAYAKTIIDNWNPNTTSASYKFSYDKKLVYMPKVDTSKVTDMSSMFYNCYALSTVPMIDTSKVTNMREMFHECYALTAVPQFDTSNVTDMYSMFFFCASLTEVPLFDTSKVTNMQETFRLCQTLKSVPLLNTSNVTNMYSMFASCEKITTVPQFDTSKVTNTAAMFNLCSSLTTVPQFDTSNVTNVKSMFSNCTSLTNFGGLLNIGQAYTSTFTYDLSSCSQLTDESIQNVINCLYDMTSKGFSPTLKFHSDVFAKLSEEQKTQITAKNWIVTA